MTDKQLPLFPAAFLERHITSFRLSDIADISHISSVLRSLVKEWNSGKIESLKEEEIKSRFVNTFFGDVLGFNYCGAENWQIREEKKSSTDGSKPDAVLGYHNADKSSDDVRVVIEVKNSKTNLDKKQSKQNPLSPVEQAFNYVPKMGGNCRWVVVTNLKEIRFYAAGGMAKCQTFKLAGLEQETELRRLLFLFYKDRFLAYDGLSPTDRLLAHKKKTSIEDPTTLHIIDELWKTVKIFKGLNFVDPEFLSSIAPFNVLKEHVWHYGDGALFTLNGRIYALLEEVKVENGKLIISENLLSEAYNAGVLEGEHKIREIFVFLNKCLISRIEAIRDYTEIEKKG